MAFERIPLSPLDSVSRGAGAFLTVPQYSNSSDFRVPSPQSSLVRRPLFSLSSAPQITLRKCPERCTCAAPCYQDRPVLGPGASWEWSEPRVSHLPPQGLLLSPALFPLSLLPLQSALEQLGELGAKSFPMMKG